METYTEAYQTWCFLRLKEIQMNSGHRHNSAKKAEITRISFMPLIDTFQAWASPEYLTIDRTTGHRGVLLMKIIGIEKCLQ